jgi:hypothetical protein
MHALVRFAHIAAGSTFTTAELYPHVLAALQMSADQYSLASLRYDLSKLRAKALVEKLPQSRRDRLCPQGYCICLGFLKLFEPIAHHSPPRSRYTGLCTSLGEQFRRKFGWNPAGRRSPKSFAAFSRIVVVPTYLTANQMRIDCGPIDWTRMQTNSRCAEPQRGVRKPVLVLHQSPLDTPLSHHGSKNCQAAR